jgi:hypothetical protein
MRPYRLIAGTLVVFLAAGASAWWKASTRTGPARPPVAEYPETLDLGPQRNGRIVSSTFRVTNRGDTRLELSRFRTSCSCAGVEVHDHGQWKAIDKAHIAPGDALDFTVRISVGAMPGLPQRVMIQFDTNAPERTRAVVEAVIPVVTADVLSDPAAVSFGSLPPTGPATRSVTVYDCGIAGRRIGTAYCTVPDRFEVRVVPLDGGEVRTDHPFAGRPIGRVDVVARADRPGPIFGELVVEMQDPTDTPCRVPLSGEVVPVVDVSPSVLYLPKMISGRSSNTASFRVFAPGGQQITARVQDVPAGLTARIAESGRETVVVEVTGVAAPGGDRGQLRRSQLRLAVESPAGTTPVEVPVFHP